MKHPVTLTINGMAHAVEVESRALLVQVLRDDLNLTGTHVGCDTSQCGACTVLLDGHAVKSCTLFAVQAEGHAITTIEGFGTPEQLHPLQTAFWEKHGLQCGFCTPGMILSAVDLLRANPDLAVESTAIPAFYAPLSIVLEEHVSGRNVELRLKRCEVDIESFLASQRPVLKGARRLNGLTESYGYLFVRPILQDSQHDDPALVWW